MKRSQFYFHEDNIRCAIYENFMPRLYSISVVEVRGREPKIVKICWPLKKLTFGTFLITQ